MTKESAATLSNPTNLPARFEIRRLTERHIPWACAIVYHSNLFHSPIWPNVYSDDKFDRFRRCWEVGEYLIRHQVESGYSFGVFDLEYEFKRKDSAPHGKLYWDFTGPELTAEQLLDQMDFPLVSIALAYDRVKGFDMAKLGPLMECMPLLGFLYHVLEERDPRNGSWIPTQPKQVLSRNATATRHDAEGKGLMRKLAEFLMRHAAEEGFKAIQIECFADSVHKVWMSPPAPFKASLISEMNTGDHYEEKEIDGKVVSVCMYKDVKQYASTVSVDLNPTGTVGV
ncbi:hypothetical protein RBB50_007176 [Rhinocladiella similis]